MAHSIVLEWDPQRVRAAVGSAALNSPSVQRVISFTLDGGEESDEVVTMAESMAAGLKQRRLGKGDTTVVVERSAAELRVLCVPPVPPEELPAVVNFQANREFTSLGEGWLLDYAPLPALPNGQQRVLAGAISPQVASQIRGCCDNAGLSLKKVILRPFAVTRLLSAAGLLNESCVLVELLEDTAELTVLHNGEMHLTRSIRTSTEASPEATCKQVLMELKRTLTSFRNQQQNAEVQHVWLMVPAALREPLADAIAGQLSVDCQPVDPWELFSRVGSTKGETPEGSECFAAVLGGLCAVPEGTNEIDFVNPTRPPAPPSNRRRNILIGAVAATLLLSLGGLYWMRSSQLDGQIDGLRSEISEMSAEDQKYQDRMKEIELLDEWVLHRVNWLEEMGQVSRRFPLPEDAILDNLGLTVNEKENQAVITMAGRVSSTEAIRQLEEQLRDPSLGREISGKNNSPTSGGPYKYRFDETLTIDLLKRGQGESGEAEAPVEIDASVEMTPSETPSDAAGDDEAADDEAADDAAGDDAAGDDAAGDDAAGDDEEGDDEEGDDAAGDDAAGDDAAGDDAAGDDAAGDDAAGDDAAADDAVGDDEEGDDEEGDDEAGDDEEGDDAEGTVVDLAAADVVEEDVVEEDAEPGDSEEGEGQVDTDEDDETTETEETPEAGRSSVDRAEAGDDVTEEDNHEKS